MLPDVGPPPGDREHEPLVLQEPDRVGYHVFAHVIGLLERAVRRQRTTGPLPRGYPAAEDGCHLLVQRHRASMINCHL